jgi:hypothetical protein
MVTEVADLADADEARVHAGKLWEDEAWQMDVTDERGLVLFVINVSAR